jgi:hypothetical protein
MYMYIMYIPGRALSLNVVSDNKGSRYINIKDRQASETKQGRSSWMQFVENSSLHIQSESQSTLIDRI